MDKEKSAKKEGNLYECSKCGYKITDQEDEWISSYPRCPRCNQNTMVASVKGKISIVRPNCIRINHTTYDKNYFHHFTQKNEYDEATNTLTITIDKHKLMEEILRKLARNCTTQNTVLPNLDVKILNLNIYCLRCNVKQDVPLNTPYLKDDKENWTETMVECVVCGNEAFIIKKRIEEK